MRNPLLVPDLRELIRDGEIAGLRDFFVEHHPARLVELMDDLDIEDADAVFNVLPPRNRAEVMNYLGKERQAAARQGDAAQGRR